MTLTTAHIAFFGDAEQTFKLTPVLIVELENKVGAGIGAIFSRLTERAFRHGDILETIRLGLIGGGMHPMGAAQMVTTYAADRPLAETLPIAIGILDATFFGTAEKPEPKEDEINNG